MKMKLRTSVSRCLESLPKLRPPLVSVGELRTRCDVLPAERCCAMPDRSVKRLKALGFPTSKPIALPSVWVGRVVDRSADHIWLRVGEVFNGRAVTVKLPCDGSTPRPGAPVVILTWRELQNGQWTSQRRVRRG